MKRLIQFALLIVLYTAFVFLSLAIGSGHFNPEQWNDKFQYAYLWLIGIPLVIFGIYIFIREDHSLIKD